METKVTVNRTMNFYNFSVVTIDTVILTETKAKFRIPVHLFRTGDEQRLVETRVTVGCKSGTSTIPYIAIPLRQGYTYSGGKKIRYEYAQRDGYDIGNLRDPLVERCSVLYTDRGNDPNVLINGTASIFLFIYFPEDVDFF